MDEFKTGVVTGVATAIVCFFLLWMLLSSSHVLFNRECNPYDKQHQICVDRWESEPYFVTIGN